MNVTLTDLTPVARYDNLPWTSARLEESATEDGDFTEIDTFALIPADTDPKNPATRVFTSDNGTIENAWYRVVWIDAALAESKTPAMRDLSVTRAYRPLVREVAQWIRTRTVGTMSSTEHGTFTADTRPKYQEALAVIDQAMEKIEGKLGPTVPAELVGSAKNVVALRAAMEIELSFFGNQLRADRSPYNELKKLYDEALADYLLERKQLGADGIPGDADDLSSAGMPVYSFPTVGGRGLRAPGSESPWPSVCGSDLW